MAGLRSFLDPALSLDEKQLVECFPMGFEPAEQLVQRCDGSRNERVEGGNFKELLGTGIPRKDALKQVAAEHGVPRRDAYKLLMIETEEKP